ncbi:hypothetical protein POF50_000085 [Streptomyces sp. SL13]|jgi:uncharacterized membrane-anchored protein|uniref:Membrane-anchored protein n=1 Tax=Streptantibioticus silvisoli TaxID=2705255 RepID=A0AA90GTR2_9ACTN|nr:hypothetical protein [Streptantibioticus silvisoli]MDI5963357.1 hypothetical protein [Streptantibioticus silvisoli]MDI5967764.1 hypothetical protein [Streptantibioticus silvisoli]
MSAETVRPVDARPDTVIRLRLNKVPEVTAWFWIIKVLTTGMGESTSDFLAQRLGPIPAVGLAGVVLAFFLVAQLVVRRHITWLYWTTVVMVSVFGTMAADVLHVGLGVPYALSTTLYAVVLAVIFGAWYAVEGTLSIHSIRTVRREIFYWATVMATFALGTATGDLTASSLHLGYLTSGIAFAVLIALPAVAHRWAGLNAVFAFWFAYVVTRPLGASFADWGAVSTGRGGLGFGTEAVSIALALVIACLVGVMSLTRQGRSAA